MNKINAQFPSLDSIYFPRIDYSRTLQVKIKGRWNSIANIILTNFTCEGRKGLHLLQWPEVIEIRKDYPEGTEFRFTHTTGVVPYLSVLHEMKIGLIDATPAEKEVAEQILMQKRYYC